MFAEAAEEVLFHGPVVCCLLPAHTTSKHNMAVLICLTHCYILRKFALWVSVRVRSLGLVSLSEQYFRCKNVVGKYVGAYSSAMSASVVLKAHLEALKAQDRH